MPNDRLNHQKQRDRPQQHGPGWINGDRQSERKGRRDNCPYVRYEAQHRCEDAPQDRAWNADQPETHSGALAASLGLSSSLLRSFNMPDARSSVPRPAVVSRNDWILSLIVD